MKLTTRGRYAVTAMLDLAMHESKGPVSLAEIATRQGISLSYLEHIVARLRKCELVRSTRGPGGGYTLSRNAGNISAADVICAVDEKMDITRCHGLENCQGEQRCLTHDLWKDLSDQIQEFLSSIDLAQLVNRRSIREVAERQNEVSIPAPSGPG
jgi:Rrf2 family iron-sulfur cluster assembly transcriptional regulator